MEIDKFTLKINASKQNVLFELFKICVHENAYLLKIFVLKYFE